MPSNFLDQVCCNAARKSIPLEHLDRQYPGIEKAFGQLPRGGISIIYYENNTTDTTLYVKTMVKDFDKKAISVPSGLVKGDDAVI